MTRRILALIAVCFVMGCGSSSDQAVDAHNPADDIEHNHEVADSGDDVYARPDFEGSVVDIDDAKTDSKETKKQASSSSTSQSKPAKKASKYDTTIFRGVTFGEWKRQASDLDPKFRLPAIQALAIIVQHLPDPEVLTLLTEATRSSVAKQIRTVAVTGLAHAAARRPNAEIFKTIFGLLRDSDQQVRSIAAAGIAKLEKCWSLPTSLTWIRSSVKSGDRLEATVSALVLLSQSPEDAKLALDALTRLYARPINAKKDGNDLKRAPQDDALESLGQGFSVAYLRSIPHILSVLAEKESDRTPTAMLVLAAALSIEKPSSSHDHNVKEAVKMILPSLKSQNVEVRATAATVLGTLRPTDSSVGLQLFRMMRSDASSFVRNACADSLAQLADIHEQVIPSMLALLRDTKAGGRELALVTLGKVLAAEHPGTRDILVATRDADAGVRRAALLAIEDIGIANNRLVATLRLALQDDNASVRQQSARILGRLGVKAQAAVRSLQVAFEREPNADTKHDIAKALNRIAAQPRPGSNQQAKRDGNLR